MLALLHFMNLLLCQSLPVTATTSPQSTPQLKKPVERRRDVHRPNGVFHQTRCVAGFPYRVKPVFVDLIRKKSLRLGGPGDPA